jgi:hypothetical protein
MTLWNYDATIVFFTCITFLFKTHIASYAKHRTTTFLGLLFVNEIKDTMMNT